MDSGSGQIDSGQNFNQMPQPHVPSVNNNAVGSLVASMNQDYAGQNIALENAPAMERLLSPEHQTGPKLSGGQPLASQPTIQVQQPVVIRQTTAKPSGSITVAPPTATDNDKIEQEWVDTAKKVIGATRSDPYAQASAVADLMRDYVRKRYGKEVGKSPRD